jgi:cytochrome c-type biogenesis protein CcmF
MMTVGYKEINKDSEEDNASSREFWMFIGSLVLLVAAFQITFTTSIPVINKLLGTNLAPPIKPVQHYNSWQIPFAIIVALIMAVSHYFKFKNTDLKVFYKKTALSFFVSIVFTAVACYLLKIDNAFLIVLFFASFFSVAANFDYWMRALHGNIKKAGSNIAHIGFGLVLLGALIATGTSQIISQNTSGIDISKLGKEFSNMENIMLAKNDTLKMGEYFLTYKGKTKVGVNYYYAIDYLKRNKTGKYDYQFTLNPILQNNPRMGLSAEPDTKHYLHKDVYTHITYAEVDKEDVPNNSNEFHQLKTATVSIGDTIFGSKTFIVLESIYKETDSTKFSFTAKDIAVGAKLNVVNIKNENITMNPVYVVKDNMVMPLDAVNEHLGLKLSFTNIHTDTGKIDILVSEKNSEAQEFIILKAIVFPFINVLWIGCIIMVIGTIIAIIERVKKSKLHEI